MPGKRRGPPNETKPPGGPVSLPATPHRRGISRNRGRFALQAVQVFSIGLMIGMERAVLEAVGFGFLLVATFWDIRQCRHGPVSIPNSSSSIDGQSKACNGICRAVTTTWIENAMNKKIVTTVLAEQHRRRGHLRRGSRV